MLVLAACHLVAGVEDRSVGRGEGASVFDAASLTLGEAAPPARLRDAGCDLDKPFDTPELLGAVNSVDGEFGAALSADELELFFTTTRRGSAVVHRATRDARDQPFGPGAVVEELQTIPAPHWSVSLSLDGKTLYVTAKGPPRDVFMVSRSSRGTPFGAATRVSFDGWSGAQGEEQVFVNGRGQLYLGVQAGPQFDLYITPLGDAGALLAPVPLVFFNTPGGSEAWPVESADGLTFFYASGTGEASEILESRRTSRTQPFPAGRALSFPLSARKHPLWISPDGCRLYLSQDNAPGGTGGADLWMTERLP